MTSGIFFQGDGQSPGPVSSMSGPTQSGLGVSMNHGQLNSTANSSGPSIGASSLVTDGNSVLSRGPHLQRSSSINNESYMRVPASPMSFSSINNVMDGSSIVQQSPQVVSSNTSHSISSVHAQKKPRMDTRQGDFLQQQAINQNLQLNAFIQQQRLAQQRQQQQQQILQHMQRGPLMSQHLRPSHMQVQPVPPPIRNVDASGLCARRLMQYMYHQHNRPPDNSILYWRKFVAEYFAPRAKKRWCLSMYDNVGSQALGAFPQAAMDAWQCDVCHSKTGKGFEATYEVLPRLNQIKFDRGVMDELLFLDMPHECRLSSGLMVLEYEKAIQETVYEQIRVVREGRLRITFTPELKILSWEFCARRHEEFFSRRAIAPQVNQLLQVAHKYQTAVNESGAAGIPVQDLQASCNMFVTTGRQLVKNLDLHSLNDLGFSKRYVRCLQISEVVNNMKDLIDFSKENKIGPIESLKSYAQQASAKLQSQKMQHPDHTTALNKIMGMNPGLNNNNTTARFVTNNPQIPVPLNNNYQYLLRTVPTPNNNPSLQKSLSFNGASTSNPHQKSNLEQHAIHRFLQEMNKGKGASQQSLTSPNPHPNSEESNSLKSAANNNNNNSSSSSSSFNEKPDLLQNLEIPELDNDILREFAESGIQW